MTEFPTNTGPESTTRPPRGIAQWLGVSARGVAMGAADVVPGVSGGTMAFILGIYEELLASISSMTRAEFWQFLLKGKLNKALDLGNFKFLAFLSLGIGTAILSLAHGLEFLLNHHPALLWSFFFGLVLASVVAVVPRVGSWAGPTIAAAVVGTLVAYLVVGMVPTQTPSTGPFLFASGFLAICAMILPGISGAFILVLLGKYQQIISAVNDRDLITIAIVGSGAAAGLLSFARVLTWLLKRYHDITIATLIGMMVGSLRKIWPWKETLEVMTDRHGATVPLRQANILPDMSTDNILLSVGLAVLGFALVLGVERLANKVSR